MEDRKKRKDNIRCKKNYLREIILEKNEGIAVIRVNCRELMKAIDMETQEDLANSNAQLVERTGRIAKEL